MKQIIASVFSDIYLINITARVFKLIEANWEQYNLLTQQSNEKYPTSQNVNKEAAQINRIILSSANLSIPHTSPNTHHPWWNKHLDQPRKQNFN